MTDWLKEDIAALSSESDQPLRQALLLSGLSMLGTECVLEMEKPALFVELGSPTKTQQQIIQARRKMGLTPLNLSTAYQRHLANNDDRQAHQGSYYTPSEMTEKLTKQTLGPLIDKALRNKDPQKALLALTICDPSCGSGHFLIAAIKLIASRAKEKNIAVSLSDIARCVYGIDIDSTAVLLCRLHIWLETGHDPEKRITCDDALFRKASDWEKWTKKGSFDAILTNPPYVDSERMKKTAPKQRLNIAKIWSSAKGNWDLFVPFVELGMERTKPGGRAGFVTPIKLFGADYCATIQAQMLRHQIASATIWETLDAFENATVAVMTTVIVKEETGVGIFSRRFGDKSIDCGKWSASELQSLPKGHWSLPFYGPMGMATALRGTRLGDFAEIRDGATTGEAYQIRDHVVDREPQEGDLKLINTGLIDPHCMLWGKKPIRYLGFKGLKPVISGLALKEINPKRLTQAMRSKTLVAGMGKRIEAVAVPAGVLCGKSTVQIIPKEGLCPYAIAAWLNSDWVCRLYAALFQLRGMGKGALNIGPRQIKTLPISEKEITDNSILSRLGKRLNEDPEDIETLKRVNDHCRTIYERPMTD